MDTTERGGRGGDAIDNGRVEESVPLADLEEHLREHGLQVESWVWTRRGLELLCERTVPELDK